MKKFTKEDWKEGKCALKWEEENKEKINNFLKECNRRNSKATGSALFYTSIDHVSYGKGYYSNTRNTSLPIITINELLEEEEFVLPEKWCIEVGDPKKHEIFKEWRKTVSDSKYNGSEGYLNNSGCFYSELPPEYTELTFEQFKKYILNNTMETKKIIGYKLIKPKYEEAAAKIAGYASCQTKFAEWMLTSAGKFSRNLKEAGVLDLWFEPIYEGEQYKVGDWVVVISNLSKEDGFGCNDRSFYSVGKIGKISKNTEKLWGYSNITWCHFEGRANGITSNQLRKATEAEIKEAENALLLEEAKRRYPAGVKIKCLEGYGEGKIDHFKEPASSNEKVWLYGINIKGDCLCCYKEGKWAEIISHCPQITINDYTGEFFENYVKFGCAEIASKIFISLYELNSQYSNRTIQSITIGKGTFSKEQIKEIAEYYLNKK